MLGEVEAFDLLLLGCPHADDEVGDLQQDNRPDKRERHAIPMPTS